MRLESRLKVLEFDFKNKSATQELIVPSKESLTDFLTFQKYFFKLRTGIDFRISSPISRQSHHIQLANIAPKIFNQEINRLMINIAPRYGKTEWAVAMMLYGMAYFPKSKWMYISIDTKLAKRSVKLVMQAMALPEFQKIYGVKIVSRLSDQSSISFTNNCGGEIYGVSAQGGIAGNGAGIQNYEGFGGGIIIDDFHKIDEVHSETKRDHAARTYVESIVNRLNNREKAPIIFIGQITHEDDLPTRLKEGKHDIYPWHVIELLSLDDNEHALYPEMDSVEILKRWRNEEPYMFAAQHQQRANPAGGAVFKEDRFVLHDREEIYKKIFYTFLVIDSAETDKNYSDPTAMVFCGLYNIEHAGISTGEVGLHIIDVLEEKILPDILEETVDQFYTKCCMFHVQPKLIGVEKKSTGVTLLAKLAKIQGVEVVDTIPFRRMVDETGVLDKVRTNLSKTNRFLACTPWVSRGYVSLTEGMKYAGQVIKHMGKITANDTHKHDDIADCICDAIYMVYITKYIPMIIENTRKAFVMQSYEPPVPVRTGGIQW